MNESSLLEKQSSDGDSESHQKIPPCIEEEKNKSSLCFSSSSDTTIMNGASPVKLANSVNSAGLVGAAETGDHLDFSHLHLTQSI